jgi:type IV secretory pathway VirB9-like protein
MHFSNFVKRRCAAPLVALAALLSIPVLSHAQATSQSQSEGKADSARVNAAKAAVNAMFSPVEPVAPNNNPDPITLPFDNRVVKFPYAKGAIYSLYTTPGNEIHIELQPDEQGTQVAMKDKIRWTIHGGPTNFFVGPSMPGIQTSLTIVTTKRSYTFDLRAGNPGSKRYAVVSFDYPDEQAQLRLVEQKVAETLAAVAATAIAKRAESEVQEARGIDIDQLNRGYEWNKTPSWAPTFVADDGKAMFLMFPANQPVPVVFDSEDRKKSVMLNVVARKSGVVVIPRLVSRLSLNLGGQEIIVSKSNGASRFTIEPVQDRMTP